MAQSPNDPLADQVLHIQLLQEKNRLMKRMKKTDDTKLEREQGFNTYFSGANTILADRLKQKNFLRQNANNTVPRKQWSKPNDDNSDLSLPLHNLPTLPNLPMPAPNSASILSSSSLMAALDSAQANDPRTAKQRSKWAMQSVEIKTDSGQRVKVRPPSPDAATAAEMSMDSHTPLHATIGLNATSMFTPFNADLGECSTTEASMALIDPASLLRPLPVANSDNPTGTLDSNREDEAAADEYDDYEDEHSAEAGEPVSLSLRRGDISMLRQSLQQDNLADAIKVEKANSAEVKQSDIAEEADESETVQACADVLQSMAVENNDAGVSEPDGPSSLDSSFVSHVLPKLSALDQNKRKFLMDILEKLETGNVESINPQLWGSLSSPAPSYQSPKPATKFATTPATKPTPVAMVFPADEFRSFKAQPSQTQQNVMQHHALTSSPVHRQVESARETVDSTQEAKSESTGVRVAWSLTLRMLSSWGHSHTIGLTQIEVLDANGAKIRLAPSCLNIAAVPSRVDLGRPPVPRHQLARLIAGPTKTVNERQMWTSQFPLLSDIELKSLELSIHLPTTSGQVPVPAFIRVWNYNRSIEDIGKGVKDAEVVNEHGQIMWRGQIKPGCGNSLVDYSTLIPLSLNAAQTDSTPDTELDQQPSTKLLGSSLLLAAGDGADLSRSLDAFLTSNATAETKTLSEPSREIPVSSAGKSLPVATGLLTSRSSAALGTPASPVLAVSSEPTPVAAVAVSDPAASVKPLWLQNTVDRPESALRSSLSVPILSSRGALPSFSGSLTSSLAASLAAKPPVTPAAPIEATPGRTNSRGPSPSPASVDPAASEETKPERADQSAAAGLAAAIRNVSAPIAHGRRRTQLDESIDTLAFFEQYHQGRLGPPPAISSGAIPLPAKNSPVPVRQLPIVPTSDNLQPSVELSRAIETPSVEASTVAPVDSEIDVHALDAELYSAFPPALRQSLNMSGMNLKQGAKFANNDDASVAEVPAPGNFVMPTKPPHGRQIIISILSTWGDEHYVGLSGIELYGADGSKIEFGSNWAKSIRAFPSSVNDLPGYGTDPRVVSNLLDGVNATSDDLHVWLAPYNPGQPHVVIIDLPTDVSSADTLASVAMLRIFNYNKSRVHAARGVRNCEIFVDRALVFRGEVGKAPGGGTAAEAAASAELIVFTDNAQLLSSLSDHVAQSDAEERRRTAALRSQTLLQQQASKPDLLSTQDKPKRSQSAQLSGQARKGTAAYFNPSTCTPEELELMQALDETDETSDDESFEASLQLERPSTGEKRSPDKVPVVLPLPASHPALLAFSSARSNSDSNRETVRPRTSAGPLLQIAPEEEAVAPATDVEFSCVRGRVVTLLIRSSHGDPNFVGLTALSVVDAEQQLIDFAIINAYPRDINEVPGHYGDTRTLDKLSDGVCVTCDDNHMWLAPFIPPMFDDELVELGFPASPLHPLAASSAIPRKPIRQWLEVDLGRVHSIAALRVYNYNKNSDDIVRGIKAMDIFVDGRRCTPPHGAQVRVAPGHDRYDFGQTIFIDDRWDTAAPDTVPEMVDEAAADFMHTPKVMALRSAIKNWAGAQRKLSPTYTAPLLPRGFSLRLVLQATHGDISYIGLNGIELFDEGGNLIPIAEHNIAAYPQSIADVLPKCKDDVRVLRNLIDGVNCTFDARHMWLTTFAPFQPATVYLFFDQPITLSALKLYNYSRTPSRGVQNMLVFMDEQLIWEGPVRRAPDAPKNNAPLTFGQSILFTANEDIIQRERPFIYDPGTAEQEVTFYDNRRLVKEARAQGQPMSDTVAPRPHTSVPKTK